MVPKRKKGCDGQTSHAYQVICDVTYVQIFLTRDHNVRKASRASFGSRLSSLYFVFVIWPPLAHKIVSTQIENKQKQSQQQTILLSSWLPFLANSHSAPAVTVRDASVWYHTFICVWDDAVECHASWALFVRLSSCTLLYSLTIIFLFYRL